MSSLHQIISLSVSENMISLHFTKYKKHHMEKKQKEKLS